MTTPLGNRKSALWTRIFFTLVFCAAGSVWSDQITLRNGDRYAGKIVSMTADTIVLQSEVLGKISVPRSKVGTVSIGAPAAPQNTPAPVVQTSTNQANISADTASALQQLGANTNLIEQVRKQFLSEAGPAANNKYDDMVGKMMSGKFDINQLRAEAKNAIDQIKSLKQQSGDVGEPMNTYLTILENFLKQTSPSTTIAMPATTNSGSTVIR